MRRTATKYQKILEDGLNGISISDTEAQDPSKLRWRIRTANETFARNVERRGHKWAFKTAQNTKDPEFRLEEDEAGESDEEDEGNAEDIYNRIREVHKQTKGIELQGTVHPHIITIIFRQQSQPWENISKFHVSHVTNLVDQFLKLTFQKVVEDPQVLQNLRQFLRPHILDGHSKAHEELRKLLHDERGGILQTVNHYLAETLARIRSDRAIQRLEDAGYKKGIKYDMVPEQIAATTNISNDDSAVYDIHDIVKSYYKVAMKRFLDNVIIQVVERHILGPNSPLRLFSSDFVDDSEDEEVKFIAAESSNTTITRSDLNMKLERLQKALKIAQGVAFTH